MLGCGRCSIVVVSREEGAREGNVVGGIPFGSLFWMWLWMWVEWSRIFLPFFFSFLFDNVTKFIPLEVMNLFAVCVIMGIVLCTAAVEGGHEMKHSIRNSHSLSHSNLVSVYPISRPRRAISP